jgi:hypothetical protein
VASYDKLIKYLVEKLQAALAPLVEIAKNQNILVAQNKQIIDLLAQQSGRQPEDEQASPSEDLDDNAPPE